MEAVQVVVCNASIEVVVRAAPINARRAASIAGAGRKGVEAKIFKAFLMAMSLRAAMCGTLLPSENRKQRMHFAGIA